MITARELMTSFAARTGVTGSRPQRRYLWTDAFAVCNLLGLDERDLARSLIDRVHHVLGRHRADDTRHGWLSGDSDADGELHPTRGGLRIGKPLPERDRHERIDERLEWERDGQYFHYLTKWMHALDRAARILDDRRYELWAHELAITAHRRFVHGHRMSWKMSIDLTRPQVASMGQHDPLDGYVTCVQLRSSAGGTDLDAAIADFRSMIDPMALVTTDPLGIGGLLVDVARLAQLDRDAQLRSALMSGTRLGLERYEQLRELEGDHGLAFRELGLAIGIAAVELVDRASVARWSRLRESIIERWSAPARRNNDLYASHRDINDVMLATSLAPEGFVLLG